MTLFEKVTEAYAYQQRKHDLRDDYVEQTVNSWTQFELLQQISEALEEMRSDIATDCSDARHWVQRGASNPYDERVASSAEHLAAQGIIANFSDRRAVKHGLEHIDLDIRQEMIDSMAAIIRAAHAEFQP